jgi:O-antigen biosynthesis protein
MATRTQSRRTTVRTLQARAAAWLTDRVVVVVGPFEGLNGEKINATAEFAGDRLDVAATGVSYSTDGDGRDGGVGLVVARMPPREDGRTVPDELRFTWKRHRVELSEIDLIDASTESATLAREELAALDADTRNELVQFLAGAVSEDVESDRYYLSEELHRIREALRERLPVCVLGEAKPWGLQLDALLAADDRTYWIKGWFRGPDPQAKLGFVSPEGCRAEISVQELFRFPRPDVARFYAALDDDPGIKHGFIGHLELSAPSRLHEGWIGELRNRMGDAVEVKAPNVVRDPNAVRDAVLKDLALDSARDNELARDHALPVLARLLRRVHDSVGVQDVREYGSMPKRPAASIVVPLYGRIDLLEHQLFHFSKDSELRGAELIYVLDSPEQADALATLAEGLYAIHRVPFKTATLSRNAGFAVANNIGARFATADHLLLLNSDVIPDRPGWLGRMKAFYQSTPDTGALAPKLLYEDDSLQHAGLYFYRPEHLEVWENAHCFKGAHRKFPPANVSRPVPAVTAACMMISRRLYEEVGGLSGEYVRGDYEDSDLCMRLCKRGLENWYLAEVELYHLEAQSYLPHARRPASDYNRWLHTHRWGEQIEALMASFEPHVPVDGAPDH